MRIKLILMTVVVIGLLFSLSASAIECECGDPITFTPEEGVFTVPMTGLTWVEPGYLPKFDTSLGELKSVKITSSSCGWVYSEVDNEDKTAITWGLVAIAGVTVTLPEIQEKSIAQFGTSEGGVPAPTGADSDAAPDLEGDDYYRIDYGTPEDPICSPATVLTYDESTPATLAFFEGDEEDVFNVIVNASGKSDAIGPSPSRLVIGFAEAGAEVTVEYTYCPRCPHLCINGTKVGCEDEPLAGWTITLTKPDGSTDTRTTDANGEYSFCGLLPGNYKVSEETRAGWYPVGETSYDVQLPDLNSETGNAEDINFKNTEHFCISGYKYNVTNNVEEPLAGWKITLLKPDGSTVTDTTDANGYYQFCDLTNGLYKVSEELISGWIAKSPTTVPVELYCENESVDFRNAKQPNLVCVCPFFIKNDLYGANIREVKVVDASKGILYNDPAGSVVLNPESITIDPKYGTLTVEEDGSFVYDPTVATGRLYSGQYVIFKYTANNGLCDSQYPGIAKIQLRK